MVYYLNLFNYILVLIFGVLISLRILECSNKNIDRMYNIVFMSILLIIQGLAIYFLGENVTTKIYPVITHIPLIIYLVLYYKRKPLTVIIAVAVAYSCCQIPHWIEIFIASLTDIAIIGDITYTISILLVYILLRRMFSNVYFGTIASDKKTLLLLGGLPVIYYLYDYLAVVYSDLIPTAYEFAIYQFLPTALIVFYVLFLILYNKQIMLKVDMDMHNIVMQNQLRQYDTEINSLKEIQMQNSIFHHDMRHHLNAVNKYIMAGDYEQATAYINGVLNKAEEDTYEKICGNELINLISTDFKNKAKEHNIDIEISSNLPKEISVPDIELCSLISNGLENAINAVKELAGPKRRILFKCFLKENRLLIEIKNPYESKIEFSQGIPSSKEIGHGYGCKSIKSIAEKNGGIVSFAAEEGTFTLKVVIPSVTEKPPL